MIAASPILVGVFEGFSWIRFEGKGSFLNSPAMKDFGEARIDAGDMCIIVDLDACTGMDSTFMGTLAGMAARLSAADGGVLEIAEPGERNRRSLEDLGLDFLMKIDPPAALWRGQMELIREELRAPEDPASQADVQRVRHVLEAHQTLSNMSEKNAGEFAGVVKMLKEDLSAKEESAGEGGANDDAESG